MALSRVGRDWALGRVGTGWVVGRVGRGWVVGRVGKEEVRKKDNLETKLIDTL